MSINAPGPQCTSDLISNLNYNSEQSVSECTGYLTMLQNVKLSFKMIAYKIGSQSFPQILTSHNPKEEIYKYLAAQKLWLCTLLETL